eukprot:g6509.t1
MLRTYSSIRTPCLRATKGNIPAAYAAKLDRKRVFCTRGHFQKPISLSITPLQVALDEEPITTTSEREVFHFSKDITLRNRFNWAILRKKVDAAKKCLQEMDGVSVFDYNKLMKVCLQSRRPKDCRDSFDELLSRGFDPNEHTYSILLNRCVKDGDLEEGVRIIQELESSTLEMDEVLYNVYIRLLMTCNMESEALHVLHQMTENGVEPSVTTYNVIIGGYSRVSIEMDSVTLLTKARNMFEIMLSKGIQPDFKTYLAMSRVALKVDRVDLVATYIQQMKSSGFVLQERECADLIYAFAHAANAKQKSLIVQLCWDLQCGLRKRGVSVSLMTLNALTKVYTLLHRWDLVFGVWNHFAAIAVYPATSTYSMVLSKVAELNDGTDSDMAVADAFIDMVESSDLEMKPYVYGQLIKLMIKHNHLDGALTYLSKMKERKFKPDTKLYNMCMSLSLHPKVVWTNKASKGICMELFNEMRENSVMQDDITYNSAIRATIKTGDWISFQFLLDTMEKDNLQLSLRTYNVVLNGCAKMNDVESGKKLAWQYFEQLKRSDQRPSVVTYTTMIDVCVSTKDTQSGIALFDEMTSKRIKPTIQTYTTLMHLVGDAGMLDMAFELFNEIESIGLTQNRISYCCLLNACGTAKRFDKAVEVFTKMKCRSKIPDSRAYGSIIYAAGQCKRSDFVIEYYKEMKSFCTKISESAYNSTLRALIECEAIEVAQRVLSEMQDQGIRAGGYSANVLKGMIKSSN